MKKQDYLTLVPQTTVSWQILPDGGIELETKDENEPTGRFQKLFHRKPQENVQLDAFGTRVWQLIDGKRTVKEIADSLQSGSAEPEKALQDQLTTFLAILQRSGCIAFEKS